MPGQNAALLNLDHAHCRAICDEIGERLGLIMRPVASDIPPRLLYLIGKLAELESTELENLVLPRLESMPSIAPSAEEMSQAAGDIAANAA
jgi:hypothetical protein